MMEAFFCSAQRAEKFEQLQKHIEKGAGVMQAAGCIDAQKTQLIGALKRDSRAQLVIVADEQKARQMLEESRFYMPETVYFPARDILFYQSDVRGNALTGIVCLHIRLCGNSRRRSSSRRSMLSWSG